MAFVINKAQYKSLFDSKVTFPGPGAYDIKQPSKEQLPAPFNASACKQSCFEVKPTNLGPGSYSRTSIAECFKPKSTVTTFKSKAARFPYQQKSKSRTATQPEQNEREKSLYELQQSRYRPKSTSSSFRQKKLNEKKEYLNELRKRNQERKINSIVNHDKGKVRILLSKPQNTQNIESFYIEDFVNIKQNGPGEYDIKSSIGQTKKSVVNWAYDKQKRFRRSKSMIETNPGPGSYNLAGKPKRSLSKNNTSSFSYGGVRTFLDTILYKTTNHTKASILQSKGMVKDTLPGPADYSPQKNLKQSFYYGQELMGSTVKRFEIQKEKVTIPGPGHYKNAQCKLKYTGLVKEMRQKIFGKHGFLVKEHHNQDFVPLQKELNELKNQNILASYQPITCSLKQRCQSKAGTISHEPRFKDLKKTKEPGPGQYYSQFNIKPEPEPSGVFKSGTQRQPFLINKQNSSGTFYDVKLTDISTKTHKIREKIDSLKKVAIQKPGFDSSVARFSSLQKSIDQSENKIGKGSPGYERDQIDYESFKPYKQKTSYASVFRSTTTRQPFLIKNNPGPGSYEYRDLLNKASHNAQYYTQTKQKSASP